MKSIRNIAFSALLTLGAFSAMTYTACSKDECEDVVCQNGGTCADGICTCASGWEGTNCEVSSASKVKTGPYNANETCNPVVSGSGWSSTVSASANDKTRIVISNFGASNQNATAFVNGNAITLDPTTLNGLAVTGSGQITGNVITITYTASGTGGFTCNMTMTAQ